MTVTTHDVADPLGISAPELAQRLRVGVVAHEYVPHVGGVETVVHNLVSRLAERHDVVLVTSAYGAAGGIERTPGLEVHRVPVVRGSDALGIPYPVPTGPGLRAAVRALAHADVLHAHGALYPQTMIAAGLAARLGTPLVLTEHVGFVPYASPLFNAVQRAAWRVVGRRVLAHARQAVALNARVASWLGEQRPGLPVAEIANGVCTHTFRPRTADERRAARGRFGLPAEGVLALLVARRAEKKNVDAVLGAERRSYVLVTCGAERGQPADASDAGVVHLGPLPYADMAELYAAADVLVHAGTAEGFPVAVQEAMAAGVPVALLWDEAYRAAVPRHAVAAFDDLAMLGSTVERLARDAGWRAELAARGRAEACARWSWDATATAYERCYTSAVRERGAERRGVTVRTAGRG